jgi:hypothetical protein
MRVSIQGDVTCANAEFEQRKRALIARTKHAMDEVVLINGFITPLVYDEVCRFAST